MINNKKVNFYLIILVFIGISIISYVFLSEDRHENNDTSMGIINIENYGANGNDQEDDTAAIRKAFSSLKDGDTLFFPSGTFKMTGEPIIISKDNVTITGSGTIQQKMVFKLKEIMSKYRTSLLKRLNILYMVMPFQ